MAPRALVLIWMTIAAFGLMFMAAPLVAQEEGAKKPPEQAPAAKPAEPAQEAPAQPAPPAAPNSDAQQPAAPAPDKAAAEAAFNAKFNEWKQLIVHLRQLRSEYQTADESSRAQMEQDWEATVDKAQKMLPELVDAVAAAYRAAPNEDREKTNFLVKVLKDYVDHDKYEQALKLGRMLIDNQCDNPDVLRDTGIASFTLCQFDETQKLFDQAAKANTLQGGAAALRDQVATYKEAWAKELETRKKEAEADDLPRVKLTTNKGDIVVELFENEAPETVGNFVSLVKKGFYNGLTFHRVISGFMAQGGCPEGDGTGGPGYSIYDECDAPGARKHFRGVLSMAKTNAPNSGGSQFFITFRPCPQLDGKHTVFGRVIEGMDVVDSLQRRDPETKNPPEPDKIIKAEVLRDRGHEYLPHKVE